MEVLQCCHGFHKPSLAIRLETATSSFPVLRFSQRWSVQARKLRQWKLQNVTARLGKQEGKDSRKQSTRAGWLLGTRSAQPGQENKAVKGKKTGRRPDVATFKGKVLPLWTKLQEKMALSYAPAWYQQLSEVQEGLIITSGWLSFATAVALLLRVAAFNPACVPSSSMAPTLLPGDCVFVEIPTYRFLRPPKRGEVVVFFPPSALAQDEKEGIIVDGQNLRVQYVKRVVAVAGDTVEVTGGRVLVNGTPRKEEAEKYQRRERGSDPRRAFSEDSALLQANYELPPLKVPPGALFVLGDNRNRSQDSHVWGFLPESRLVGRCWFRWSPFTRLGVL